MNVCASLIGAPGPKFQRLSPGPQKTYLLRKIIKTYLAIVSPSPINEKGIINLPIYKGGFKGHQKMIVDPNRGKKAITEFKVLDKASSRAALLALYPKTGRTHQLRVHLEYINTPIVGDKKYTGSLKVYPLDHNLLEKSNRLGQHLSGFDYNSITK